MFRFMPIGIYNIWNAAEINSDCFNDIVDTCCLGGTEFILIQLCCRIQDWECRRRSSLNRIISNKNLRIKTPTFQVILEHYWTYKSET